MKIAAALRERPLNKVDPVLRPIYNSLIRTRTIAVGGMSKTHTFQIENLKTNY